MQELIKRIENWNKARYPREYVHALIVDLLYSELQETKDAIDAKDPIETMDGIADVFFVAIGGYWKTRPERPWEDQRSEYWSEDWIKAQVKKLKANHSPGDSAINDLYTLAKLTRNGLSLHINKDSILIDIAVQCYQAMTEFLDSELLAYRAIKAIVDSNDTKEIVRTDPAVKANISKGPNYVPPTYQLRKIYGTAQINKNPLRPISPLMGEVLSEKTPQENSYWHAQAVKMAGKSSCNKRKVGAVIVTDKIAWGSWNQNDSSDCEDEEGNTLKTTVHAESACITFGKARHFDLTNANIYITQPPCEHCLAQILDAGIPSKNIHIVETFMKFDTSKVRVDLVPPSLTQAIAPVFMYGAKKYKPFNWLKADTLDRYVAAVERHFLAYKQEGSSATDEESGFPHLYMLACNIAMLIELERRGSVYVSPFNEEDAE